MRTSWKAKIAFSYVGRVRTPRSARKSMLASDMSNRLVGVAADLGSAIFATQSSFAIKTLYIVKEDSIAMMEIFCHLSLFST